jgi:hypothetical protein
MSSNPSAEKPVAAFVLSLIAGLLMLAGSGMMTSFFSGGPYYGGMMGGYYNGMMNGDYGIMGGFGVGSGWAYALATIGVISGIIILIGAIMIYNQPARATTWGILILAFSIVSLFGMGGFFVGAILGVVGGVLALTWKS